MTQQLAPFDDRTADALAEVHEQEVLAAGGGGLVAEGEGADLLDEADGERPDAGHEIGERQAFGPVQVGGVEHAARGFVHDPRDADQHGPQSGARDLSGVGPEAGEPGIGRGTGGEDRLPGEHAAGGERKTGQPGPLDAQFDGEEAGLGGVEAKASAGPAEAGRKGEGGGVRRVVFVEFLEQSEGEEFLDDLAGGGLADGGGLGEVGAGGGAEATEPLEDGALVEAAEAGRDCREGDSAHGGHGRALSGCRRRGQPGAVEPAAGVEAFRAKSNPASPPGVGAYGLWRFHPEQDLGGQGRAGEGSGTWLHHQKAG
ncbi:MAG: hypothetical protein M5U12_26240 [Verrucomicrobia bacterium]|nr:hypothetical protein [Verrucomicrobiota bacterium]